MARILVASLPFVGHVGPLSAVAGELARRGHRVVAYTGTKYQRRFAAAGAQWLPWRAAPDFDDADLAATFPRIGDGKGGRGAIANSRYVLFGTAPGQAQDILAAARQQPFDLLVTDQLAFGGAVAGEKLGIPWATVAVIPLNTLSRDLPPPGITVRRNTGPLGRLRNAALRGLVRAGYALVVNPQINRMRATVGLGRPDRDGPDGLYSPHLVLAQGVPGLEYPRTDLPPHIHLVGRLAPPTMPPPPADPAAPAPANHHAEQQQAPHPDLGLPGWWPEVTAARDAGRAVVHITQGTLDVDPTDLVRPAIAGLGDGPELVVCTTGGADPAALGPLPANVRVARFLPHDRLLPLVDVMVTNGGWGGVLAATQAGVPLVVAGDSLDKPEVARRVAYSGVGVNLRTGRPAPAAVRRAVSEVLAGPAYRERAAELGAAIAAAGGTPRAADLIEKLLSGRPAG
ncbi:glycosyltransferase [Plantactinospora sp. GCM10030261]|uniref:glycosyltransferase n=1 Tax=Plantactinospora sp. GCM10030261 TaxID=3273420 RepID=UPI00361DB9D1